MNDENKTEAEPAADRARGEGLETVNAPLISADGDAYDIPVEGSLGLLAMGYAGIMLWREKRYGEAKQPE